MQSPKFGQNLSAKVQFVPQIFEILQNPRYATDFIFIANLCRGYGTRIFSNDSVKKFAVDLVGLFSLDFVRFASGLRSEKNLVKCFSPLEVQSLHF